MLMTRDGATFEHEVARHYTHGALADAIWSGLRRLKAPGQPIHVDDLAPVDEFHTGGRQATADLVEQLDLRPGVPVLDLGSGLGGTARYLAHRYGCRVTGVDLTEDYVRTAETLTHLVGLGDRVAFHLGKATDLTFADESFARVTLLHVGMNIPDKGALCAEAARVLAPAGLFAIYDMMRTGDGALQFPVPWASRPETSFVADPGAYRLALADAGFEVVAERDRRAFALGFFEAMAARIADQGPPPLGLHILMGAEARSKVANVVDNIRSGKIAPVEIIARRR